MFFDVSKNQVWRQKNIFVFKADQASWLCNVVRFTRYSDSQGNNDNSNAFLPDTKAIFCLTAKALRTRLDRPIKELKMSLK